MSAPLIIRVPGVPVPKGRPRFARVGNLVRTYTPAKTADYESEVRDCVLAEMQRTGARMMFDALVVHIEISVPIPASWSRKKRGRAAAGEIVPTTRPDLDNFCKILCDAANGHVWHDDAQIVDLHVSKRYGEPSATMTVNPLALERAA